MTSLNSTGDRTVWKSKAFLLRLTDVIDMRRAAFTTSSSFERLHPVPTWGMDRNLAMDNLEMRLQVLESRIYGEKRSKSAKPVKVGWEYCLLTRLRQRISAAFSLAELATVSENKSTPFEW